MSGSEVRISPLLRNDRNSMDARYIVLILWTLFSLAHTELYLAIASIFRRFNFELYDTDLSDIELKHDFFLPSPKLDSAGLRVKVVSVAR